MHTKTWILPCVWFARWGCQGDGYSSLIFHVAPGPCVAGASASWQWFPGDPSSVGFRAPCARCPSPVKAHRAANRVGSEWPTDTASHQGRTGKPSSFGFCGCNGGDTRAERRHIWKGLYFWSRHAEWTTQTPLMITVSHSGSTSSVCFLDCHSTLQPRPGFLLSSWYSATFWIYWE